MHFPEVCAWILSFVFACVCLSTSCGDDDGNDPGDTTPGGAVCPDAIDGSAVWTYSGDDSQCTELAAMLTAQGDDDDPSDAEQECAQMLAAFALEADGASCRAELAASCDGRTMQIECTVELNGAADCKATIRAAELEAGSCVLGLVIAS